MSSFGDFNRVNTNLTAMDAQLSLNKINRDLGESRLRLSTGFKINNAEDDAAGFAIANKLKSRVAGLEQSLQNVADAKSVLGIVEGAYGSIMDNLIEMKALATQGANETLGSTERDYIGTQIEALADDINSTAKSTTFQGVGLLDGNGNSITSDNTADATGTYTLTVQSGEGINDQYDVVLNAINIETLFVNANAATDLDDVTNSDAADNAGNIVAAINTVANAGTATAALTRGSIAIDASVSADDYRDMLTHIDDAIATLNSSMNQVGIDQRSLSNKEINLTEAITANSAARSRIMDTDFAKEQSNSIRLQILQQTATAALSQANMGPQAVLGFLG